MAQKNKQRGLLSIIAVCVVLLALNASPAQTQSYAFSVPLLQTQVFVQPDASVRIVYDITFDNDGDPIDVVDIGLPHRNYDIANMTASVGGVALSDIRPSEYIDVGVEVHLGSQAIPSGQRGTLHFECTMPNMVYQDTTNKALASLQFTPTWFDGSLLTDTGNLQLAVHIPAGITADEVLYQTVPFTAKVEYEDHVVALWEWQNVYATQAYPVGVSFPQKVMTRVVKMSLLDLTKKWLEDNPQTHFFLGFITMALLTFLFFRFSGGTGCVVYGIVAVIVIIVLINNPLSIFLFVPLLIPLVWWNERSLKKKRKHYIPPVAQVEGGGIKRGLTAPEAAVLLEMPLNKVLTLVIFGMLEKGLIVLVQDNPLTVNVAEGYNIWATQENRRELTLRHNMRRKEAQHHGTVIHKYEQYFLDQLERQPKKTVKDVDFEKAMAQLINLAVAKMKGFDLSDTQDYYRRVIDRAMEQAAALGEVEQREAYLDKYLPWVMMNDNYPTVLSYGGMHYWPVWSRPLRTTLAGTGMVTLPGRAGSRPAVGGRTSFGDVAASFAGWTESTMGGLAATILPASLNLPSTKGGVVNLGGVDRVTGDVFRALLSSSGSSSGGSRSSSSGRSSCACACAGCACACACAGGGR